MLTETDEDKMDTRRILVIGKSGNGKSSLCNTLCGGQHFKTGSGPAVTTRKAQSKDVHKDKYHIQVVDTPDVTNPNMNPSVMQEEVSLWRELTQPYPTLVLLAVRCDVRYTAEMLANYRQIKKLWGDDSLKKRLVVAFTFGDRQDKDLGDELRTAFPELKVVLRDASQRYVLFNNKEYDKDFFQFSLYYVYYALILAELLMHCFAESLVRTGYDFLGQKPSPETMASFPSRLTFWWINSLVLRAYRKGLEEEDVSELHPRDKSSVIVPRFTKGWDKEIRHTNFRKS